MKTKTMIAIAFLTMGAVGAHAQDAIAQGKKLVETKKCSICHAIDGKGGKTGKPMNGIAEGKTDEFLKGSLLEPKKTIAPDTKMPAYKFTEEEVKAVIEYMKSLKAGG